MMKSHPFFKKDLFIYLVYFLTMVGLCCCTQAFSNCPEQGLPSIVERGLQVRMLQ